MHRSRRSSFPDDDLGDVEPEEAEVLVEQVTKQSTSILISTFESQDFNS